MEVSYTTLLSNETRIRRYEINDNEILDIYKQINKLKDKLDNNEENFNKAIEEVLIDLAKMLYILKIY